MPLQWWCSATGVAWTWSWRAYPGVWLVIAALVLGMLPGRPTAAIRGGRRAWLAGSAFLWASLDWPLGTLGAGYLLSAHALQFLLIVYVAAPLLLAGMPRARRGARSHHPMARRVARTVTHPAAAAAIFAAVLVGSHLPFVLDALRPSQFGSFALDVAWLLAGLALWWPVVVAVPERPWFGPPVKMLYLFGSGVPCVAVGIVLTLTELPLYGLYELAPRVEAIPARTDQQAAGILMWVVAHFLTLAAISVVFLHWARRDLPEASRVDQGGGTCARSSPSP